MSVIQDVFSPLSTILCLSLSRPRIRTKCSRASPRPKSVPDVHRWRAKTVVVGKFECVLIVSRAHRLSSSLAVHTEYRPSRRAHQNTAGALSTLLKAYSSLRICAHRCRARAIRLWHAAHIQLTGVERWIHITLGALYHVLERHSGHK